jgi:hypothetical protein
MARDSLRLRQLATLKYYDPATVLRELRQIEFDPKFAKLPDKVRQMRTQSQKVWREGRIGLLFAYGMGLRVLNCPVTLATGEAEDYDFVTRWMVGDTENYSPIQEKEWPPLHLNDQVELEEVLARLGKSTAPTDTVALVHLNRRVELDLQRVRIPAMNFKELWFIGATTPDQNDWVLVGDVLHAPQRYDFKYPS